VAYATDSVLRRGTQISYATRAEFDRFYPVMKEA
jgi:pyruvate/oxaloacetate carboxyltransferase